MINFSNHLQSILQQIANQQSPAYPLYLENFNSIANFVANGFTIPYYNTQINQALQATAIQLFAILRTVKQIVFDQTTSTSSLQANQERLKSLGFDAYIYLNENQLQQIQALIPEIYKSKGSKQSIQQLIQYLWNSTNLQLREFNLTSDLYENFYFVDTESQISYITSFITQPASSNFSSVTTATFSSETIIQDLSIASLLPGSFLQNFIELQLITAQTETFVPYVAKPVINYVLSSDPLWKSPDTGAKVLPVRTPYFQVVSSVRWVNLISALTNFMYQIYLLSVTNNSADNCTVPFFTQQYSTSAVSIFIAELLQKLVQYNQSTLKIPSTTQASNNYFFFSPSAIQNLVTYDQVYSIIAENFNFSPAILSSLTDFTMNNLLNNNISLNLLFGYLMSSNPTIPIDLLQQYAADFYSFFPSINSLLGSSNAIQGLLTNFLDIGQIDYEAYWSLVNTFNQNTLTMSDLYTLLITPLRSASNILTLSQIYYLLLQEQAPALANFIDLFQVNSQTFDQFIYFTFATIQKFISLDVSNAPFIQFSQQDYENIQSFINFLKPIYTRPLVNYFLEELIIDSVFPSYLPVSDGLGASINDSNLFYSSLFIGSYVNNDGVTLEIAQPWTNLFNTDQRNAHLDQPHVQTDLGSYLLYPRSAASYNTEEISLLQTFSSVVNINNPEIQIPYSLTNTYLPAGFLVTSQSGTTVTYTPTWCNIPTSFEITPLVLTSQIRYYQNTIKSFINLMQNNISQIQDLYEQYPFLQVTSLNSMVALHEMTTGRRKYYARYADDYAIIMTFDNEDNITEIYPVLQQ